MSIHTQESLLYQRSNMSADSQPAAADDPPGQQPPLKKHRRESGEKQTKAEKLAAKLAYKARRKKLCQQRRKELRAARKAEKKLSVDHEAMDTGQYSYVVDQGLRCDGQEERGGGDSPFSYTVASKLFSFNVLLLLLRLLVSPSFPFLGLHVVCMFMYVFAIQHVVLLNTLVVFLFLFGW